MTRPPSSPDHAIARLLRLAKRAGLNGVEESTSYSTPSLKLRGKFLARLFDATTLAIRCPLAEKEMLMQAEPQSTSRPPITEATTRS